jgi:hypothetical protein
VSAQRLWQAVELDHRAKVQAAAAADARHRPRDEMVKVRVLQEFWVGGRVAQPGETVEIPKWLVSGLQTTGHIEKV